MSKQKIENIKAESDGYRSSVMWQVGADRFHVWLKETGEPEETVYKNSIAKHDEPGHYNTRQLDRINSQATRTMFENVWQVVERDGLIAKAKHDDQVHKAKLRTIADLNDCLHQLDIKVLEQFKAGTFNRDTRAANELHEQYLRLITYFGGSVRSTKRLCFDQGQQARKDAK